MPITSSTRHLARFVRNIYFMVLATLGSWLAGSFDSHVNALTYGDLVWGESRLAREPVLAAQFTMKLIGVQTSAGSVMGEVDILLTIPIDAPQKISASIALSEVRAPNAPIGAVRQRVRIGGETYRDVETTIRTQIDAMPDTDTLPTRRVIVSFCESLLISGFRADLLREVGLRSPEGRLRNFWADAKTHQAIISLAAHCLYQGKRKGASIRNPLERASFIASISPSSGHTSNDMAVSIKGSYFTGYINTKKGDDLTRIKGRLMTTTVEGLTPPAGGIYAVVWRGNPSTGQEEVIFPSRHADPNKKKIIGIDIGASGIVDGNADLIIQTNGRPPTNAETILRKTDIVYLLILKHLLISEKNLRKAALESPAPIKTDTFLNFWTPAVDRIERSRIIEMVSQEISKHYMLPEPKLRRIQQALAALGHYKGSIDGLTGPATQSAIRAFEASIGSFPDGYLTNWETALIAPDLLDPLRYGPETDALARALKEASDEKTAQAFRVLEAQELVRKTPPEDSVPWEVKIRMKVLQDRIAELEKAKSEKIRALKAIEIDTKRLVSETKSDLAQCYCGGAIKCLSVEPELPDGLSY